MFINQTTHIIAALSTQYAIVVGVYIVLSHARVCILVRRELLAETHHTTAILDV